MWLERIEMSRTRNRGTNKSPGKKGKDKNRSQTEDLELLMEADGRKPLEVPPDHKDSG